MAGASKATAGGEAVARPTVTVLSEMARAHGIVRETAQRAAIEVINDSN